LKIGIRGKLFLVSVTLVIAVVATSGLYLEAKLRSGIESMKASELLRHAQTACELFQSHPEARDIDSLDPLADRLGEASSARVTVIAQDGTVLGDSELTPAQIRRVENHGKRPEIVDSLSKGHGKSKRHSKTLGTDMVYLAAPCPRNGERSVVRVAMPLVEVDHAVARLQLVLFIAAILGVGAAVFMSGLASFFMSRALLRVAGPRARVDEPENLMAALAEERDRFEAVRQEFVANVSHELRTPVSIIRANTETLLSGAMDDPENAREFLDALQRNAERLSNLIDDLLDVSKIDSGEYRLDPKNISVEAVTRYTMDTVEKAAEAKHMTLDVDLQPDLRVFADEKALGQVLFNLLDNAIKYTPGGGHISVRARGSNGSVRIEVCDDGPGIEPEHRQRIFERFYRVDAGRSREMGGTGLGLSIVKNLIEAMGGQVGLDSNTPSGSIFWLTIPAGGEQKPEASTSS
jgi:signal transduction histidine kinase